MDPVLHNILDRARWAPSGDNTQCWRFEPLGERRVRIHCFDTRDHCVYDLDGHPSQISMGTLLETLSIAASVHGLRADVRREVDAPETHPRFDVELVPDVDVKPSPLAAVIETRSVQRRPLSTKTLTPAVRAALASSLPPGFRVSWYEGLGTRARFAKMLFHSAKLRLITPEAYEVHRDIIEWHAQTSEDRVPDAALGASPPTVALMRMVLKSWERVAFFNRFLAGTWAPRIELDVLPALACAAHFTIEMEGVPRSIDDYVAAGRAAQRFWLAVAAQEGLQMQPEITPLVFSRYSRFGRNFSRIPEASPLAHQVRSRLEALVSPAVAERAIFMGRVGYGAAASARSVRKPLQALLWNVEGA